MTETVFDLSGRFEMSQIYSNPELLREVILYNIKIYANIITAAILFILVCIFVTCSPTKSSAQTLDYQELQEEPLETAFRKLTTSGSIEWDDDAVIPGGVPDIIKEMAWPIKTGSIGGYFNRTRSKGRRKHHGVDLLAPKGTPIHAVLDGTVEVRSNGGKGFRGYGMVIIINHGNKLWTLYSHCSSMNVHVGQKVKRDQVIATVGRTGRASANHLHFEVRNSRGLPLDPMKHLPKNGALVFRGK